jgi:hypothetical protein
MPGDTLVMLRVQEIRWSLDDLAEAWDDPRVIEDYADDAKTAAPHWRDLWMRSVVP